MESQNGGPDQEVRVNEEEINLLDLLIILARQKIMILSVTFVATIFAVVYALLQTDIYTGVTKILPPKQGQFSSGSMSGKLGDLIGMVGGGVKDSNAIYIAMLKSNVLMEKVAQRFDLQKVYGKKTMQATLRSLDDRVQASVGKDGLITVEVDNKDPKLAADMANAFIEELDKLMHTFSLTDASQQRQFFEAQMKLAKDKLTNAEILLDKTPNTSLHYMDAVRNLKYQESIYDILSKQFAVAKLEEAKDYPLVQTLDKAVVPERKSKPIRRLIVIRAAVVAFALAIIWAFIREALTRAGQQPEQKALMSQLRQALRWKS